MFRTAIVAFCSVVLTAGMVSTVSSPAEAKARVKTYKNCTALNKDYKHGVGLPGAKDKTSGKRVTSFTKNKKVYQLNKKSDRDKDGIACEKR